MENSDSFIIKTKNEWHKNGFPGVFRKIRLKLKKFFYNSNCSIWYSKKLTLINDGDCSGKEFELKILNNDKNELIEWLKQNKKKFPGNYFEKEIDSAIQNKHVFFVLKDIDKIIGFLKVGNGSVYIHDFDKIVKFPDKIAFVYDTLILPEYRGKNLAQCILYSAFYYFYKEGFTNIFCHIENWNIPSIKTFTNSGFQPIDSIRFVRIIRLSFFIKNRFFPFFDFDKYLDRKAGYEQA